MTPRKLSEVKLHPRTPLDITRRAACVGLASAAAAMGCRDAAGARTGGDGLTFAGVNLAGGEFGKVPGTYGVDYTYPEPKGIDYFAGLGFNLIRVPFLWERLQPALNGPLAAFDLARLTSVVDYAVEKGLHVVLDTHNYARRRLAEDGWTSEHLIGSGRVPEAAFLDYCRRLAASFKDRVRLIFGLMNEPWGLTAERWLPLANQAIAAMRREGAEQLILVPGVAYSGAHSWLAAGNDAMRNVADPIGNFAFEVHQYFDVDSSAPADCRRATHQNAAHRSLPALGPEQRLAVPCDAARISEPSIASDGKAAENLALVCVPLYALTTV